MNEKEQQLAEFREDIRQMGPDGTTKTRPSMGCKVEYSLCSVCGKYVGSCGHLLPKMGWEKMLRKLEGELFEMSEPCPPKYMDVINKNMEELLA